MSSVLTILLDVLHIGSVAASMRFRIQTWLAVGVLMTVHETSSGSSENLRSRSMPLRMRRNCR